MNNPIKSLATCVARSQRGVALVFALASVLIVAVIVLGVTTVTQQHYALARVQTDAAAALNVAEAGMHWELSKMSRWEYGEPGVTYDNTSANAYSGPISGINGSDPDPNGGAIEVYVTASDRVSPWVSPNPFIITSSGTIPVGDGTHTTKDLVIFNTSRKFEVFGQSVGLGDLYALYGINTLALLGSSVTCEGYMGSAGLASIGASTSASLKGTFVFEQKQGIQGSWAVSAPSWDWVKVPNEYYLPTIDQIGTRAVARKDKVAISDPISYFSTNNDNNDTFMKARPPGSSKDLVSIVWKDPADGTELPHNKITERLFEINSPNDIVLVGNSTAVSGGLRKGSDFYFEKLEIKDGRTLEIQNADGPVRIWLGPRGASITGTGPFDFIKGFMRFGNGQGAFGAPEPDAFSIYNATRVPIHLGGTQMTSPKASGWFYGNIYAFNKDVLGGYGEIQFVDRFNLRGSALGWTVSQNLGAGDLKAGNAHSTVVDPYRFVMYYSIQAAGAAWSERAQDRASSTIGAR